MIYGEVNLYLQYLSGGDLPLLCCLLALARPEVRPTTADILDLLPAVALLTNPAMPPPRPVADDEDLSDLSRVVCRGESAAAMDNCYN